MPYKLQYVEFEKFLKDFDTAQRYMKILQEFELNETEKSLLFINTKLMNSGIYDIIRMSVDGIINLMQMVNLRVFCDKQLNNLK